MENEKLKILAAYYIYGLKLETFVFEKKIETMIGLYPDSILTENDEYSLSQVKPILRPLSDLTKEIEVNGKKIIPIVELCKISEKYKNDIYETEIYSSEFSYGIKFFYRKRLIWNFQYYAPQQSFFAIKEKGATPLLYNQKAMFDYMHSLWFDTENLIEKGESIDMNTIENC